MLLKALQDASFYFSFDCIFSRYYASFDTSCRPFYAFALPLRARYAMPFDAAVRAFRCLFFICFEVIYDEA